LAHRADTEGGERTGQLLGLDRVVPQRAAAHGVRGSLSGG
jgi:hypothetical protein